MLNIFVYFGTDNYHSIPIFIETKLGSIHEKQIHHCWVLCCGLYSIVDSQNKISFLAVLLKIVEELIKNLSLQMFIYLPYSLKTIDSNYYCTNKKWILYLTIYAVALQGYLMHPFIFLRTRCVLSTEIVLFSPLVSNELVVSFDALYLRSSSCFTSLTEVGPYRSNLHLVTSERNVVDSYWEINIKANYKCQQKAL